MPIDPPKPRLPPLNALRAFEAAARHESFVKAAQELGVTPAAIAQHVKSLEYWVRRPLFTRLSQGLRLTPAARLALPRFTGAFDGLGDAVQALRRAALSEQIRIAALPSVAQLWLQPRTGALRRRFPELELSVTALEEPPRFTREPYDLAIFYLGNEAPHGATIHSLGPDELFPVCSPALMPRKTKALPLESLSSFPLLHDATWRDHWDAWLHFAGVRGVDTRPGPTFSLYSLAVEAALDGAGLLIGRRALLQHLLEKKQLVAPFDIPMPAPNRLCLLLPDNAKGDRTVEAVADWFVGASA
jgi:LysR family glycine cleavage system transcriptional activator